MRSITLFTVFVFWLGLSSTALGDVPPPDTCQTVGESCSNAEPDYKSPGVCTSQTCSKPVPGGDGPYTYPCLRCLPGSADGGSAPANGGDDGGCRISPRAGGSFASLLVVGSLLGLCFRRRKR